MADDEPLLGGSGPTGPVSGIGGRFNVPGVKDASKDLNELSKALKGVHTAFGDLVKDRDKVVGALKAITTEAEKMAKVFKDSGIKNLSFNNNTYNYANSGQKSSPHASGVGMGGVTTQSAGYAGGSGPSSSRGRGQTGAVAMDDFNISGALKSLSSGSVGGLAEGILRLINVPTKYAHDRIEANRASADYMAEMLGPVGTLSGKSIIGLINTLSKQTPVYGDYKNVLGALNVGSRAGYGLGAGNEARAGAFYENIRQQQLFTPGVGAEQLAQQNVAYMSNTKGQQRQMLLTGGAFGAFGAGGVPKTLQEWAEGILKFFEGQRPGDKRGVAFTKEELQTQFFPGSNMNAWFVETEVPSYMQDFFWQYAIGKSQAGSSSIADILGKRGGTSAGKMSGDLSTQNLLLNTAQTRREFSLASTDTSNGTMYHQYVQRAKADTKFANFMGGVDQKLAELYGSIFGGLMANAPTPIAELGYDIGTNVVPSVVGGAVNAAVGLGSAIVGAIGDPGWGPYGGTGSIGMDPSFARRLGDMMDANPRLTINSGYRDGGTQKKLYDNGVGFVAPPGQSAHGKGLAADLGPPDQFDWIVQNANKFGLDSGANFGEPWHVGFPGTVPIGDPRKVPIGDINLPSWADIGEAIGTGIGSLNPLPGLIGIGVGAANGAIGGIAGNFGGTVADAAINGDASKAVQTAFKWMSDKVTGFESVISNLLSSALGLPDLLKGGSAGSLTAAFGSLISNALGSGKSSGDNTGFGLGRAIGSAGSSGSQGFAGPVLPGSRSVPMSLSMGMGGTTPQSLYDKYAGGKAPAAYSLKPGEDQKILSVLQAARQAGFSGDSLVAIASIAGRESHWNPSAFNPNVKTGDKSYGLYQINMLGSLGPARRKQFGITSDDQLLDPLTSSRAAFKISGGGKDFSAWGGYKGKPNLYNATQYLAPVYNIAKANGFIGDPRRGGMGGSNVYSLYSPATNVSTSNSPVTMNTHITVGGGNMNDAEARRVGSVLADTLETQMKQRLARTY